MSSACSIEPAGVISPELMKKISSALAMVLRRCAMMTLVVVGGSFLAPPLILLVMPVLIDLFSRRRAPVEAPRHLPAPAE